MRYSTANGAAIFNGPQADYNRANGMLTFAPGETEKTITIQVIGDTRIEPDETFFVNLSNPQNATIAKSQGLGTILNDDSPSPQLAGGVSFTR